MMRSSSLVHLVFVLACSTAPALFAEEVVENFDDGTVKSRYDVNAAGEKHGSFEEFHPGGERKMRGKYKDGLQTGGWTSWDAEGNQLLKCGYEAGKLDGKFELRHASGKVAVLSAYDKGAIVAPVLVNNDKGQLLRTITYPHSLAELQARIAEYAPDAGTTVAFVVPPSAVAPHVAGELEPDCMKPSLAALKLFRYLSGLRHDDLEIVAELSDLSQHAAVLLSANGGLTYMPTKPADMDPQFFALGQRGIRESHVKQNAAGLVGAMHDCILSPSTLSDNKLRERRSLLAPGLKRTGFGACTDLMVIYSYDRTGKVVTRSDAVCFPGEGYFPVELARSGMPWCVSFYRNPPPTNELNVKVEMIRLDENFLEADKITVSDSVLSEPFASYANSNDTRATGGAVPPALIFTPSVSSYAPGRYWVTISGLSEKKWPQGKLEYLVEMVETGMPIPGVGTR